MFRGVLIGVFCFSICVQSLFGNLLLFGCPGSLFRVLSFAVFPVSDEAGSGSDPSFSPLKDAHAEDGGRSAKNEIPDDDSDGLKYVGGSAVGHLFTPFNCPYRPTFQLSVITSYLFTGNDVDISAIEEKINNSIIRYAGFYKIMRIGLPLKKLLFPFHNFY